MFPIRAERVFDGCEEPWVPWGRGRRDRDPGRKNIRLGPVCCGMARGQVERWIGREVGVATHPGSLRRNCRRSSGPRRAQTGREQSPRRSQRPRQVGHRVWPERNGVALDASQSREALNRDGPSSARRTGPVPRFLGWDRSRAALAGFGVLPFRSSRQKKCGGDRSGAAL